MTHEAPTPFPLPEITRSPDTPPVLLDFELQSADLTNLIDGVRESRNSKLHRIFKLRRITIQGGLVERHEIFEIPVVNKIPVASRGEMSTLFDNTYQAMRKRGLLVGEYDTMAQEIYLYPDTILLASIAKVAKASNIQPAEETTLLSAIRHHVQQRACEALIEELEHSSDLLSVSLPIFPLVRYILEGRAESRKSDPKLHELAQKAVSLKPLIPDQQILDLYHIARDSYQTFKGDSLKGHV